MSIDYTQQEEKQRIKETIELAEECGLTFTGDFEEGEPQFIGDNRAWDYFNNGGKY